MGLFTPLSGFLILRTRDEAYAGSSWDLKIVVDFAGNRVSRTLPIYVQELLSAISFGAWIEFRGEFR